MALLVAGPVVSACGGNGAGDAADARPVDARTPAAPWQVVTLPAPVLSAWGPSNDAVFFAGGGPAGGFLAALRGDRISPEAVPPGGPLWWVFGVDDRTIRAVGEGGRIVARTAAGWVDEPTGLSDRAQLWGGHSSSATTHWAVGGSVRLGGEKGLVLTMSGDGAWHRVTDPAFPTETNLYKIWGPSPDELYIVGEAGVALRWDGRTWSRLGTPDPDLLFTVHGRPGGPVLAVGGITRARVLRLEGDRFVDDGVPSGPPLNGVFVREDGTALVSGANGALWERGVDGTYRALRDAALQPFTLHAVFVAGDAWAVGGDLSSGRAGVVASTRATPLQAEATATGGTDEAEVNAPPDAALPPDAPTLPVADDAAPPVADAGDAPPPVVDAGPGLDAARMPPDASASMDAGRFVTDARPLVPDAAVGDARISDDAAGPDAAPPAGPGEPCTPPRYVCAEGTHCLQILGPEGFSEPLCLQPCSFAFDCGPDFGQNPCCAAPGPQLVRTYCIPAAIPAESCR
jgi:hypothetical protein